MRPVQMNENNIDKRFEDEKRFDVKYFFFKYVVRYWYLYVISLIVALGVAYYYNWYTTPIYNATATILIKDDKRNTATQDLLAQLDNLDNTGGIDNEIELIRSRTTIGKTLRQLDFDVSYILIGKIKKTEMYKRSPIRITYDSLSFKIYDQPIQISILDDKNYEITYSFKNDDEQFTGKHSFGENVHNKMGRFQIDKTEKFKDSNFLDPNFEKKDYVILIHNFDNLTDKYIKALKIEFISKKATVLQLSLQDPVPQKAGDFLNKLLDVYIRSGIEQKNENAANTLKFIDDQLEKITLDLKESEANLESFKTQKGITDLGTEAQAFLGSAKLYDERISEIDMQTSFLTYLENYILEDKELEKISPASIGIADPLLAKLVTQLSDLQNQRKSQLNSTKPDNPIIVSLEIQIQNTKEDLLENVRSIRDGLNASRSQANLQLARLQEKIKTVPRTQRELLGMERQANIREGLYNYLLQKKAETSIMLASTISDNRIVDSARATYKPVKPVKNQTYTLAILLGLLLPVLFVYTKDSLNDKIKDGLELEKMTTIPVLGIVGFSNDKDNLVVSSRPESQISEAFRSIRTNLQYFVPQTSCRKILITSSISSEGKSFCAANLSAIYALSGKKVVLVGADLRKPKKNAEFNIPSEEGISNYLIGSRTMDEIIQPSKTVANLDIILSGPKPPNPSELIMSSKMDEFFHHLEERYDIIIIDSPPIGIVTDGMLLSKYVDTTIYVIRQNVTRKQHLEFINSLYRDHKLPNLSVIFNAVKKSRLNYGYYSYGYGYGYGYYEEDRDFKKTQPT